MIVSVLVLFACSIMAAILAIFVYKIKHRRFYKILEQFPSFPIHPVIGNILLFYNLHTRNYLKSMDEFLERHDRQVCWITSLMPVLVLKKHDDIATVLSQCCDRDTLDLTNEWIGTGILNAKYEEWKTSRKILTPAFSFKMLSKYTDVFNKTSHLLANEFKQVADTGKLINVFEYVLKNNLDSFTENTMGISVRNAGEKEQRFAKAIVKVCKRTVERIAKPWLYQHFIYYLYLKFTNKNEVIDQLYCLPNEITRNKINNYRCKRNQFEEVTSSKRMIDLLIKEGAEKCTLTEKRIADELLQVTIAGVESSALTVSSLLLMLAINEDVQQKVYDEIIDVLGDEDVITPDHLFNQFDYLGQCIKETIRIFSPVVATIRRTHKDCLLKDGAIIPANIFVYFALHWSQLDADLYENPHEWNPENFSEPAVQSRPKSSFLSFGYGPRYCPGDKYATMSIKAQIIHILRSYRLTTNVKRISRNDLGMELSIVIKLGYLVQFASRQKQQ